MLLRRLGKVTELVGVDGAGLATSLMGVMDAFPGNEGGGRRVEGPLELSHAG